MTYSPSRNFCVRRIQPVWMARMLWARFVTWAFGVWKTNKVRDAIKHQKVLSSSNMSFNFLHSMNHARSETSVIALRYHPQQRGNTNKDLYKFFSLLMMSFVRFYWSWVREDYSLSYCARYITEYQLYFWCACAQWTSWSFTTRPCPTPIVREDLEVEHEPV